MAEGSGVTIKVKLDADPERTVTIPISKADQGGATSADYSGVPANVVFNSGDTEKTFSFSATADDMDDDGESVKLGFGTLPAAVSEETTDEAVVSITDDDVPSVSVSFEQGAYTVAEGSSVTVKVKLSADPERTVTIPISKANQGGASNSDYSGVPVNFVFDSGDTEKTFSFSAASDSVDDDGESVKLGLGTMPTGVSEGATDEATVSITDDDETIQEQVAVQVSFEVSGYALTEGLTTEITVVLSDDPERSVTVPPSITNQSGTTAADYSGVPSSVRFATGETEETFTFTAVQDEDDENTEEVTLGFDTLPDSVSAGTPAQATVTIHDSLRVSFDASEYEAYEGGAGARVTVQLDRAVSLETVIPLTAEGMNGATGGDWTGVPQELTFSSGEQSKTFTLMAYDDNFEDDGEMVELGFGTLPAGVVAGSPSTATVELMNTEVPTCETAVWCTTVEFADSGSDDWNLIGLGLGYHASQDPYPQNSSLDDDSFTFPGKEYRFWSMFITQGVSPGTAPRPAYAIPERALFDISIEEMVGEKRKYRVPEDHYQDWVMYVDGIALPFTDVVSTNGGHFAWFRPDLQDLFAEWVDGEMYQVMIVEDPVSERPPPPVGAPMAPRYVRVMPGNGSLVVIWKQPLKDGNSEITHYRLQWKPKTGSWSDSNVVEEVTVQPFGGLSEVAHIIGGLSNYDYYTVRVIAVNDEGDSEPSDEHFGMPQEDWLDITDTVVNGNQLTITYERTLDSTSVPDLRSLWAMVNGGLRDVTSVSISGKSLILTLDELPKRPIRATDKVQFRYLMSPTGSPAIKDTDGNYAVSCDFAEPPAMARNETDPALLEPVTAQFTMLPASHSGPGSEVVFQVEFSEPVKVDMGPAFAFLLEVTGGEVTSGWWLDRDTTLWQIVLEPDSQHDITVVLPADRSCDTRGAPCASGERVLTTRLEHTIPGDAGTRGAQSLDRQGKSLGEGPEGTSKKAETQNDVDTAPAAPQNLSATGNEDGSITLTWDAPDDDSVAGY